MLQTWLPIIDVKSRCVVIKTDDYCGLEDPWNPYIWKDGNFSCDCNRSLFMYNEDHECSDKRFFIPYAVTAFGELVSVDDMELQ